MLAALSFAAFGKIFTSEGSKIVEAFADVGKTEVVGYTSKSLVMRGCGNGHAHYLSAFDVQIFGMMIGIIILPLLRFPLDEAHNKADIFINPSYDRKAFQYFTFYAI